MDLGLTDRIALVCGGSRGIGFATAEALQREGAVVTICGRDQSSLDHAATRLVGERPVDTVAADLATTDGIAKAVSTIEARHGRVDVLITNTGGPPTAEAMAPAWSAWEDAAELLLRSAVELTRAFVPGMRSRGWGRVVGITSFAVRQPVPSLVLSNALRAAVTGYYRTLANEVAPDGVTVNTVMPGYTDTERLQSLARSVARRDGISIDAAWDRWRAGSPMRRVGTASEVAAVIAFLASAPAGFVTGQAWCVDGGAIGTLM